MLKKKQEDRITMSGIRSHPWLSLKKTNDIDLIQVTQEDIDSAIKKITSVFTILKAVQKLKKK